MAKNFTLLLIAMIFGFTNAQNQWTEIHQVWESGQWENLQRYTPTYNANQSAIEESLTESWNIQTQSWQNQSRVVNTIPFVNMITESLNLEWNPATLQWVNHKLQIRDLGFAIHLTTKIWDGAAWQNESLFFSESYVPNVSGVYIDQVWADGQWQNVHKMIYDQVSSEQIDQQWVNNEWVNQKKTNRQDNVSTVYLWLNGQWELSKRTSNLEGGNFLTETYDAASQSWLPESQQVVTTQWVQTPEFTGNQETSTTQVFVNGNWENSSRVIRNAGPFLGIADATTPSISLYPNPASGTVYVNSYQGEYSIVTIDGREIKRGSLAESAPIDVTGLQSGIYILKTPAQNVRFIKQ